MSSLRCSRCSYSGGQHGPGCPDAPGLDPDIKCIRQENFTAGYIDGRGGRAANGTALSYRLGFNQGTVALEEAENSER